MRPPKPLKFGGDEYDNDDDYLNFYASEKTGFEMAYRLFSFRSFDMTSREARKIANWFTKYADWKDSKKRKIK